LAQALGLNVLRILIALLQGAKFTVFLCVWIYMLFMIRWTYPRVRYDQLMKMGWKMILPLALLNIIATGAALAVLRGWI
jgi:NADH-quinone oxidoreductase subunit H